MDLMNNSNWYLWDGANLVLTVQVQTRARRNELVGVQGNALKIRLTATPVDGQANAQLMRFFADLFNLPVTRINLISGTTAHKKRLRIHSPPQIPEILRTWIAIE